jgi:hypothetical protein
MVCGTKVRREVADVLGVAPTTESTPTWDDHVYSCSYQYPEGSIIFSVQALSSWAQTLSYFRSLATRFGNAGTLGNLGQGAFSETDGSVVVRKDWKVLTVDVTHLPMRFGVPAISAGNVGITVADVVLGCWAGD